MLAWPHLSITTTNTHSFATTVNSEISTIGVPVHQIKATMSNQTATSIINQQQQDQKQQIGKLIKEIDDQDKNQRIFPNNESLSIHQQVTSITTNEMKPSSSSDFHDQHQQKYYHGDHHWIVIVNKRMKEF